MAELENYIVSCHGLFQNTTVTTLQWTGLTTTNSFGIGTPPAKLHLPQQPGEEETETSGVL